MEEMQARSKLRVLKLGMITVRSNLDSIYFSWSLLRYFDFAISAWLFRYFAGGNANHGAAGFDRIHHHRVRAHGRVVANVDAAQNLRACSEQHLVPDLGTKSEIKTHIQFFGAQRDALEYGHVAADAPGSNHGARRVGKKNPRSDLAARRNFQAKEHNIEIGQEFGQDRNPPEHGCPAHAADDDGQKPVVQQAAEEPAPAGPRNRPALKLSLTGEIAIQKLL